MAKFPIEVLKGKKVPTNKDYLDKWGGGFNLDVGCGPSKVNGFVGLDIRGLPSVDIIHDLNVTPWPLQENTAELIIASHVIEHVESAVSFMSELHRILKVGGKAIIRYPHYSQRHSFTDPTHKRFLTLESLDYFISDSELFGTYSDVGFKLIKKILHVDNDAGWILSKLSVESYEKYWCKLFPAWQVIIELGKAV